VVDEPPDAERRRPLGQVRRRAADQDAGATFIGPAHVPAEKSINQSRGVWRLGASYDLTGSGRTALKASYSRYALQVGIDRVPTSTR
jgi:hypothetical protein